MNSDLRISIAFLAGMFACTAVDKSLRELYGQAMICGWVSFGLFMWAAFRRES